MRRWLWMVGAVLLIALAAFLMTLSDDAPAAKVRKAVDFPTFMRPRDVIRLRSRVPAAEPVKPGAPIPPKPRDPVLAAIPPDSKMAVVIEANALRHSPVGAMMVECLERGDGRGVDKVRSKTGIDPLKDVDRVAVTDQGVIVSGFFENAKWQEIVKGAREVSYGSGRIYEGAEGQAVVGRWKNDLALFGKSAEEVRHMLDGLEGRATGSPLVPDDEAYGDVYGVLTPAAFKEFLPTGQQALAQRLFEAASRVRIHMDATEDVAMVADIAGTEPKGLDELARMMGGALSLARLNAKKEGNEDLVELLDYARIDKAKGEFSAQLALPLKFIEKHLAPCRQGKAPGTGP